MWHYGQSAVAAALAVICSEVGDNTFFVAVILSMTAPRRAVFAGALCANVIMHTISGTEMLWLCFK
jgi:putative Ca2+/H+ antiporter (TMEM165/GDT1 family)